MIVTELLGSMNDEAGRALVGRRHVERVVLADEDLSKRIQRVRTDHDREIGLRLPAAAPIWATATSWPSRARRPTAMPWWSRCCPRTSW